MCGICGWVDWKGGVEKRVVRSMVAALAHRGPDGEGLWRDGRGIAVLGHRRLKVLDTSTRADQPMVGQVVQPARWDPGLVGVAGQIAQDLDTPAHGAVRIGGNIP